MMDEQGIPELPVDLSHLQTEDLLAELLTRFDHSAFIGMRILTDSCDEITRRMRGNCHMVAGLLADLSVSVLDSYKEYKCGAGPGLDDENTEDEE